MCELKSITINNDIDYKMPWAPTNNPAPDEPEGYIVRGHSIHFEWIRCDK